MGGKPHRTKSDPKPALASSALILIIIWLGLSWPREPGHVAKTKGPASSAADTTSTTADPKQEKSDRAEVVTELLNLRSEPTADKKKIIGTIRKGLIVQVLERKAGWLRVKLEDGRSGYVAYHTRFISI